MASFYQSNDFDPGSPSESEEERTHEDVIDRPSFSTNSVAFGNLLRVRSSPHLMQDTEDNVEMQTGDVFVNYMYQSYHLETDRGGMSETPAPQDLLNLSRNPLTPAAEVGRRLAHLGDNFLERHASELDSMVSSVHDDDTYEAFADIARRVFAGGIRWNRILILLSFGYRMAMSKLRHTASGFSSFLSKIVSFMVKFIVREKIAQWIAQQGGWAAAINFIPGASSSAFYIITGLAAVTVLAVILSHKFL